MSADAFPRGEPATDSSMVLSRWQVILLSIPCAVRLAMALPSDGLLMLPPVLSRLRSGPADGVSLSLGNAGSRGASGLMALAVVVDFLQHFRLEQTLSVLKAETYLVSRDRVSGCSKCHVLPLAVS